MDDMPGQDVMPGRIEVRGQDVGQVKTHRSRSNDARTVGTYQARLALADQGVLHLGERRSRSRRSSSRKSRRSSNRRSRSSNNNELSP